MSKLMREELPSEEIAALRNQLLLMCEGQYPTNMKFSKYIPDPRNLCTYFERTMAKHLITSLGLQEWATFHDMVKMLADNMTTGSRVGFLDELQKFQSKRGDTTGFQNQLLALCRAQPARFPHAPTQDVTGTADRTWAKGDTDWQQLDCGWLVDRIRGFIDGETYTPQEWSEWQNVWNDLIADGNISSADAAPVSLMVRALASGGGMVNGQATRVVEMGLSTLEGYCRPLTEAPTRVPAEWAVTWQQDLPKSCDLMSRILNAVFYRTPIPKSALEVSFRKAWLQLKNGMEVSNAQVQAVERMILYVERDDTVYNAQIRPQVTAGSTIIQELCNQLPAMSEDQPLLPGPDGGGGPAPGPSAPGGGPGGPSAPGGGPGCPGASPKLR